MKPRIFINMHYMELGGAERALLGLLNALDTDKVDVDLFLNQHTGEFMPLIPDKINLLPERRGYNALERPIKQILKEGQFGVAFGRWRARRRYKEYHETLTTEEKGFDSSAFHYVADSVQPFLPYLEDLGEYDLAISFLQPHNIVLNKVKAKRKVAWIHTDYSSVHVNTKLELPVWAGFDYIAHGINLLSVGRYCHAKNYDNVPDIMKRLLENGFKDLRWYIIGFGGDETLIRQKIAEAGMEGHVILLGKKDNPYPYIKACDIYVQPSRYEGKSVTVREAQVLCKPVVVSNYPTAHSQIRDGVDGVIVPQDNEGCAESIARTIQNQGQLKTLIIYLQENDYGNEKEVEKVLNLL